jgi:arylsulfatase A-like enzyme
MIVFTSDNGPWSNDKEKQHAKNASNVPWSKGPEIAWGDAGPLRDGKGSTYEGGVRVPMIARWPGKVPPGRVSGEIMHVVDFFPTFARMAGFEVPRDRVIDGVDQSELLLGKSDKGARDTLHYIMGGRPLAVRKGDWKFFPAGGERGAAYAQKGGEGPELFNLRDDVGETKNVVSTHPEIAAEMETLFRSYKPEPGEETRGEGRGGGKAGKKSKAQAPSSKDAES